MSVGIVLVTHHGIAKALSSVASELVGVAQLPIGIMEISFDTDVAQAEKDLLLLCEDADSGDGVVILTDLYGATPSNIACSVLPKRKAVVITGLNLAMLIRAFNYSQLPLSQLRDKLHEIGQQAVVISESGKSC